MAEFQPPQNGLGSRPRFAADDRWNEARRRARKEGAAPGHRQHVRVHTSITNHPKMVGIYGDDHLLAAWLRIMVKASEKGAAHTGDTIHLSRADVLGICGVREWRTGVKRVETLCKELGWRVEVGAQYCAVTIRNFARKQGLDGVVQRRSGVKLRHTAPSPTDDPVLPSPSETRGGADAPTGPPSDEELKNRIFKAGVRLLCETNPEIDEPRARKILGKLLSKHGPQKVAAAVTRAVVSGTPDPLRLLVKGSALPDEPPRINGKARVWETDTGKRVTLKPGTRINWLDQDYGSLTFREADDGQVYIARGRGRWLT